MSKHWTLRCEVTLFWATSRLNTKPEEVQLCAANHCRGKPTTIHRCYSKSVILTLSGGLSLWIQ